MISFATRRVGFPRNLAPGPSSVEPGGGAAAGLQPFRPAALRARGTLSSEIRSRGLRGPLSQDLPGAGPSHPRDPDALPRGREAFPPRRQPARGPGAPGRHRCSGHRRLGDRSRHPGLLARGRRRRARGTSRGGGPEPRMGWTRPHPTPPHRPLTLGGEPDTRLAPDRPHGRSPGGPGCARSGAGRAGEVAGVTSSTRGRSASGGHDCPSPRAQRFGGERSRTPSSRAAGPASSPPPAAQPSSPPLTISHPTPPPKPPPPPQAGAHPQPRPQTSPLTLPHPLPPPYPAIAFRTSPTNQQRELCEL